MNRRVTKTDESGINRNRNRFLLLVGLTFALVKVLGIGLFGTGLFGGLLASELARGEEPFTKKQTSGPVTTTISLEPRQPKIGDTVTLTIEVVSKQGVEVLMPEFGEALERFTVVDFVPRQSVDNEGRTVSTQKYRLQPPFSGKQSIPPILIEFIDHRPDQKEAPDGLDAYEILTEAIEFEVASVIPSDAATELRPPMGELQDRMTAEQRWGYWLVAGVAGLGLVSAVVGVVLMVLLGKKSRRRSAYEIARAQLDRLLENPKLDGDAVGQFFVELSGIVRTYLENRFDFRAPELTTEEFLETVVGSPDLASEHQSLLREFLKQADLVKFAGVHPSESDVQQSIKAAERFLDETRENAPLIEDPEGNEPPTTRPGVTASVDKEAVDV